MSSSAHVAPDAGLGAGVELGPGAVVGAGAELGAGTVVGAGAVIEPGTVLGARCVIEPLALLGKRPRLRPGSSAAGAGERDEPLRLGEEVTVCAGAVIYAGARVEARVILGDQCQVRERSLVGERSVVGRGSCVDFGVRVGARVLIQTGVYVTAGSVVEDDVFLGPGVLSTNDDTMDRQAPGSPLRGPVFRRACRIGGGAVLVPGVEVGEEAFVAAGAVVTRDVPRRAVVAGVPARVMREVAEAELLERWR
jgi:UDP-3-O-[3-hydroxymyristoyl] glucosamine N-acyltransferase